MLCFGPTMVAQFIIHTEDTMDSPIGQISFPNPLSPLDWIWLPGVCVRACVCVCKRLFVRLGELGFARKG